MMKYFYKSPVLKQVLATLLVAIVSASLYIASPIAHAVDLTVQGGANAAKGADQPTDLMGSSGMFTTISNVLLFIVGGVAVIMIVIGGLKYVTSGGDSANITSAKNTILYALVGVIVAILAYSAVHFVINSFTGSGMGGGNMTNV